MTVRFYKENGLLIKEVKDVYKFYSSLADKRNTMYVVMRVNNSNGDDILWFDEFDWFEIGDR